jgi:hypothetical protein
VVINKEKMSTSIDLSVDELLLLQENQYHMPNFVFANIKPIGVSEDNFLLK